MGSVESRGWVGWVSWVKWLVAGCDEKKVGWLLVVMEKTKKSEWR